ncbi:MAG: D-alanine--D-alanine ligase [Planctomycetota bacterium]|nr:D-alanine--D-alanine ligase [Planctomycetota bacterium]
MSDCVVLVLMGGPDAERTVSINSGTRVAEALRSTGRFEVRAETIDRINGATLASMAADVILPILHGSWGEGGPLQELLEADGRPYMGSGPTAARLAMDKSATKRIAEQLCVSTPRWQEFRLGDRVEIDGSVVVKPLNDGSSVGMSFCANQLEAQSAAEALARTRGRALVEQCIKGREITVGMLGDRPLPLIEIIPAVQYYDYEAKYLRNDTQYRIQPADLSEAAAREATAATVQLMQAMGCKDVARADFIVEGDRAWFLEINTMPGMTDHSLVPKAAAAAGISFPELCTRLVEMALLRAKKLSPTNG